MCIVYTQGLPIMHCSIERLSHVLKHTQVIHSKRKNKKANEQIKNKQINKFSRQIKRNASHFVRFYK